MLNTGPWPPAGLSSDSATAVAGTLTGLLKLRERYQEELAQQPKGVVLVDELFVNPYITVVRAEKLLGVSNPTAR